MLPFTAGAELLAGGRSLGGDWYCVVETSTAAAGKRRLLPVLPLQLRKGVAEEHLLSLLQWKKKTLGAAAMKRKRLKFSANRMLLMETAETSLLLLLWCREKAPAGLD